MAIYYRYLFHERERISDSEGIVYSQLIYQALGRPEFFDEEAGEFSVDYVKAIIRRNVKDGLGEGLELSEGSTNKSQLARETGLTRATTHSIVKRLQEKDILWDDFIIIPEVLLDEGYFQLPKDTSLTGQQLVFYGLLKDRGKRYRGTVDTWAYRLAEIFHTTKGNVYFLLSALEKKHYLERLDDGKLRVK